MDILEVVSRESHMLRKCFLQKAAQVPRKNVFLFTITKFQNFFQAIACAMQATKVSSFLGMADCTCRTDVGLEPRCSEKRLSFGKRMSNRIGYRIGCLTRADKTATTRALRMARTGRPIGRHPGSDIKGLEGRVKNSKLL